LIRAFGPHPSSGRSLTAFPARRLDRLRRPRLEPPVRYHRTLAFQASTLTAGVLPAALRAPPASKIAPGDFVNHSATSPNCLIRRRYARR
jgi:hypothetical protein